MNETVEPVLFPANRIKNITLTDHFKSRANERFGVDKPQAEAWAKHLLKEGAELIPHDGSNPTIESYHYKAVKMVINVASSTLITCYPIGERPINGDNQNTVVHTDTENLSDTLAVLPVKVATDLKKELIRSSREYTRELLGKQTETAKELVKLIDTASRTSQPKVLKEKRIQIDEKITSLNNVLKNIHKLDSAIYSNVKAK